MSDTEAIRTDNQLHFYPLPSGEWLTPSTLADAQQWRALVAALKLDAAATYIGVVTQLELAVADVERLRRENAELRATARESNRPSEADYFYAQGDSRA